MNQARFTSMKVLILTVAIVFSVFPERLPPPGGRSERKESPAEPGREGLAGGLGDAGGAGG